MNALSPRGHLKPVIDQVECSTGLPIRIRHSIERLQLQRPVDHEESLLPDEPRKLSLLGLRKIHPLLYLFATFLEHVYGLSVLNSLQRQGQQFQFLPEPFQFLTTSIMHGLDAVCHEYRKNGEDLLERYRAHLLVELRRLGKIRFFLEILQREQLSTPFTCRGNNHRRLDLHVTALQEELPERLEDLRLDLEDSIRLLAPKIQDPPVEPRHQQRILNPTRVQGQRSLSPAHNLHLTRNNLNPPLRNLTRNNDSPNKQHILLV